MVYSVEALIELVKVNMEESVAEFGSSNVTVEDALGIEVYIKQKLPEAIMRVFMAAPFYLLEQVDATDRLTPKVMLDGSGEVIIPDDMLRMVLFKMHGWSRGVSRIYDVSDPIAELQSSPYTRGGTAKPVVIVTNNSAGKRVLRYYSLPPEVRNHEIETALYVKIPDVSTPIEINELLVPSITYTTAALVYEIMGDMERSAIMQSRVKI